VLLTSGVFAHNCEVNGVIVLPYVDIPHTAERAALREKTLPLASSQTSDVCPIP